MTLAPGELGYAGYAAGTVLGEWPTDLGDLELDRVDEYGGLWSVTEFAGRGSPPSSVEVTQRVRGHGAWIGGRYWQAKPYTISGAYEGADERARFDAEQRLLTTVGLHDIRLRMYEETTRETTVVLNGELVIDPVNVYAFTFQLELLAPDPFRYAPESVTITTGLPTQSGGLRWPATWPARWTGTSATGELVAYNGGTAEAYPTFVIYGPLDDFVLSHPDTGAVLSVDLAAAGVPLVAGEWIEVDMRRQRVTLRGTQSRRYAVRGDFFALPPGESTVLFGSSAYNATARAEMTYRATYL